MSILSERNWVFCIEVYDLIKAQFFKHLRSRKPLSLNILCEPTKFNQATNVFKFSFTSNIQEHRYLQPCAQRHKHVSDRISLDIYIYNLIKVDGLNDLTKMATLF